MEPSGKSYQVKYGAAGIGKDAWGVPSYRDLLHFLHHRHTVIASLVERFSYQTTDNRSPLTFDLGKSRRSHFVSGSIHAFYVIVLGVQLVQPYPLARQFASNSYR